MSLARPTNLEGEALAEVVAYGRRLVEDGLVLGTSGNISATTGARAVVHTHSQSAVAVSTVVDELPAIHYDIGRLGGSAVPVVGYERFGSDALARRAADAFDGRSAVILRNHGTLACGEDLRRAYHRALLVEWLAETYRKARALGEPALLGEAEMDEVLAESRRRSYGVVSA